MSDNSFPPPADEQPLTPPPPAYPAPAPAQPVQAYPGAAPTYAPPPAAQPGYSTPPPAPPQPGYGVAPVQPGYAVVPAQPAYGIAPPQQGYAGAQFPPQQGYAPYVTPGYPVPAPRPTSGLAVTSLVCGIAGIVLFWAVIPMLASIVAVITGHMALGQTKRNPALGGRGMAFAGLITGYVVVALLAFTIVSGVIGALFFGAFTLPFLFSS
ncbi:DUF4190 domain-containing protein [Microbacterium sp. EST19A]|uniref:DUF4190 domain-containing protein n=1 Tax=Microbacterium sp. EST19A TaxID=2862681 RepID=UPI001CBBC8A4|nr:DUF4190 domain-containing protein [Microbacterium sp. EST19A]